MSQSTVDERPSGWFEGTEAGKSTDGSPDNRTPDAETDVTYIDAITAAMDDELASDERVVLIGEDIGIMGGAFRATRGLFEKYGERRVIDTPIAEIAITGACTGMAISGMRPIAELQFADFISCAYDQLVNQAAKLHFRYKVAVPFVMRAPSGGGVGAGVFHSQNPEATFAHVPGLKVVCPGTVQDAYDLLRLAVADPNPVLYFEHKGLYRSISGPLERRPPQGSMEKANVLRQGNDITVVSYASTLHKCLEAADQLKETGKSVEVIDLRCIQPLDFATIAASVKKTSRVIIAHEDTRTLGIGAEIAARLSDQCFFDLDAPVMRVTMPDIPVPASHVLEAAVIPSTDRIVDAITECLAI